MGLMNRVRHFSLPKIGQAIDLPEKIEHHGIRFDFERGFPLKLLVSPDQQLHGDGKLAVDHVTFDPYLRARLGKRQHNDESAKTFSVDLYRSNWRDRNRSRAVPGIPP